MQSNKKIQKHFVRSWQSLNIFETNRFRKAQFRAGFTTMHIIKKSVVSSQFTHLEASYLFENHSKVKIARNLVYILQKIWLWQKKETEHCWIVS